MNFSTRLHLIVKKMISNELGKYFINFINPKNKIKRDDYELDKCWIRGTNCFCDSVSLCISEANSISYGKLNNLKAA